MELKARQNGGLYVQARKFAQEQISSLLKSAPGIKDKYEIVFEWSKITEANRFFIKRESPPLSVLKK